MKVRVICLSKALDPYEAIHFATTLSESIIPKFVYSGMHNKGPKGTKILKYYVVRIPEIHERLINAHEMMVEKTEILETIR